MFDSEEEKKEEKREDDSTYLDMTCSVCYESMASIAQETKKQQDKEE